MNRRAVAAALALCTAAIPACGQVIERPRIEFVINRAIGTGQKKRNYSSIRVPILAVSTFTCALAAGGGDAIRRYEVARDVYFARWRTNLRNAGAPVRVVDIPRAAHHVFLSHEADVLREVRDFVVRLR